MSLTILQLLIPALYDVSQSLYFALQHGCSTFKLSAFGSVYGLYPALELTVNSDDFVLVLLDGELMLSVQFLGDLL